MRGLPFSAFFFLLSAFFFCCCFPVVLLLVPHSLVRPVFASVSRCEPLKVVTRPTVTLSQPIRDAVQHEIARLRSGRAGHHTVPQLEAAIHHLSERQSSKGVEKKPTPRSCLWRRLVRYRRVSGIPTTERIDPRQERSSGGYLGRDPVQRGKCIVWRRGSSLTGCR